MMNKNFFILLVAIQVLIQYKKERKKEKKTRMTKNGNIYKKKSTEK